MHNNRIRMVMLVVIALLVSVTPAYAQAKPAELENVIEAVQPYGTARLSHFFFHVYDAEIWTDAERWGYDSSFALSITYAMAFAGSELAESTLEEMKHVATLSDEQEKTFSRYLSGSYRDVKDGDRISALYMPPATVRFFVNNTKTGDVKDKAFVHAFFDIWFSPRTSEPSLRASLLGAHS